MRKRGLIAFIHNPMFLLMLAVVIPGLVISGLGLVSLSRQKESRQFALLQQWQDRLERIQTRMEAEADQKLGEVFTFFRKTIPDLEDPLQIQKSLKNLLNLHSIVQYPFILDHRAQYIFPFTKSMLSWPAALPALRFSSSAAQGLFLKGENRELRERDWKAAIHTFLKGLNSSATLQDRARFSLALGRCYFKWGKYTQAAAYLIDITETMQTVLEEFPDLRFNVLHLLALAARRDHRIEEATSWYLKLYESVLAVQAAGNAETLDFFKNDALNFLTGHIAEGTPLDRRFFEARNRDRFERESAVDFSLRWSLFDLPSQEEESMPGRPESLDRERLRQIQEFYLADDDKERFYTGIQRRIEAGLRSGLFLNTDENSTSFRLDSGLQAAFTMIERKEPPATPLYIGFRLIPKYLESSIFTPSRQGIWRDTTPSVRLRRNEVPLTLSKDESILLRLSLRKAFTGKELAVVAPNPDYIARRVRHDLAVNTLLVASLAFTLLAGLFLFFRYLRREMELVGLKSRFLDTASHTLKTPLARIRMLSEQLQLDWVKGEEDRRKYLEKIIRETEGMNEMIGNLLDLSRIESGAKQYVFRKQSLGETAKKAIESISPTLENLGFTLKMNVDASLPPFEFDAEAVRLVLLNLLQNAVKYSREEKWISLSIHKIADEARIEVQDRGIGMAAGESLRIFEKFYRIESEETISVEGSGLGLYLARHAVEAHGGRITLKSEPGRGSIFTVCLPIETEGKRNGIGIDH